MGMNVVTLVGRMCADPERKTTANGVVNCPFRLAVQRRFANANGERESDFINCKAWRGTAEFVAKYARKGDQIAVSGSLATGTWTDADGVKHVTFEVNADAVELLTRHGADGAGELG